MFDNLLCVYVVTSLLLVAHILKDERRNCNEDDQTPLLLQSSPPSLTTQFIISMKNYMGNKKGPVCRNRLVLLYLCMLLLLNSYAPEPNPGPRPVKFPCAVCNLACKWTTPCVCCDSCDQWYHQSCMGMPDAVFKALENISWECVKCGVPNFSTSLFDSTIFDTSNSFSDLTSHTNLDSEMSFSCPNATSSPARRLTSASSNIGKQQPRYDLPLTTLVVNCQSLKSPGKKALLQNMISSANADIVIGTESWLDDSVSSAEVFPPDYTSYRKDRTKKQGGGVFVLIRSSITSECPEEIQAESCELLWIKVKVQGSKDLYIGSLYKPPAITGEGYLSELKDCLSRIPRTAHIWLGGDFNLPDIEWENMTTKPYANNPKQCQQIIDICSDFFLTQMVTNPTRITDYSENILDLFLTNNSTLVNKTEVIPGIGDHEAVFIETSLRPWKTKVPKRKIFIYKKMDTQPMKDTLKSDLPAFIAASEHMTINDLWELFETKIKYMMDKFIPSKMISGNKTRKPWVTKEVKSLIRKRNKLFQRQKSKSNSKTKAQYLHAKSRAQKAQRQAHWEYIQNILNFGNPEHEENPPKQKRFWSYIKSCKKDNNGISPLKENGLLHNDPEEKANILNRQYQSVFTRENTTSIPTPKGKRQPTMPDIDITQKGIISLLLKLNPNKATGPDMIPSRILKELAEECAQYLELIFKKCLVTGSIPDIWRMARVSAIFKKGDRYKAANYRPVSLTCISCKLLEHILVSNIMKHLDQHSILTDSQHGFRRKRSCETQLLTLTDELFKAMDKRKQHDLAILDFSKAFDRVPHKRLLAKLEHYGIRGNTLKWIEAFLSERKQKVVVEGAESEMADVVSGVPQGSVLGPTLFLIFINDLPETVSSSCRLFADDCIVYRQIDSEKDCHALQEDLKSLAKWETIWGMEFHPEKCSILQVHRKRSPLSYDYKLKGHTLTVETSTKYLGVDLASDLTWNSHIHRICRKGNSTLGFLRRNLAIRDEKMKSQAYLTLVRPTIEYCSTVWNPHTKALTRELEMVQRRAARYATGRHHNTSSVTEMIEVLGWETLESRRTKAQLTMLFKIMHQLVDIPYADHLVIPSHQRKRAPNSLQIRQISSNTCSYQNSFFPRTIPAWNNLPARIAEAPDLVCFRQELDSTTF